VAEEEVVAEEIEGEVAAVLETEEAVEVEIAKEAEAPVVEDAVEELAEKLGESIKIPEINEEEFAQDSAESKQRRKEQSRIMEFDPDLGEVVVRRRRKRDEDAWDKGEF
ncbi:MAG: hypothetical protein ACNYZI_08475, partial [Anaerolineales bacterium]